MIVSAKAVVLVDGRVLVGENARDELELVGGRPEHGEGLEDAARREVLEEAGIDVEVGRRLLDEPFEVVPGRTVRIVAFRCAPVGRFRMTPSTEHRRVLLLPLRELAAAPLPGVYRRAVAAAYA